MRDRQEGLLFQFFVYFSKYLLDESSRDKGEIEYIGFTNFFIKYL
jgi:hypothetical protein